MDSREMSEELSDIDSEDECDFRIFDDEELDEEKRKKAREVYEKSSCAYCNADLEKVPYIDCAECKNLALCIPCFRLGAEFGIHKRGHAYCVVDGYSRNVLPGHWPDPDELSLIESAHSHKLGNCVYFKNLAKQLNEKREAHGNKAKSPKERLSEYFDRFFIRGFIGKFAMQEAFWMRDRHKYKEKGTLNKIMNNPKNKNPLIYNLYLAAMRWKKTVHWRPFDPRLEEKIRTAVFQYMNYDFPIEGRELLGCIRDDYWFGGELSLPKPVLLNPEFAEIEEQEEEERRELERKVVERELEKDRQAREEREEERRKQQNGKKGEEKESSPVPEVNEMVKKKLKPSPKTQANMTGKRASRSGVVDADGTSLYPSTSQSSPTPSPLKIVLKKVDRGDGEKEGYIVTQTTVDVDETCSSRRRPSRRVVSFDSTSDDDTPTIKQDETPVRNSRRRHEGGLSEDEDTIVTRRGRRKRLPIEYDEQDEDGDSFIEDDCCDSDASINKTLDETYDLDTSMRTTESDEEEKPSVKSKRHSTLKNVIKIKKQKRKKKIEKSKKLRRLEAFHKREQTKCKKREKELAKYADLITMDTIREMRAQQPSLCLYRPFGPRGERTKYRSDDLFILAYNPDRNEFEMESFNDAEYMVSDLQLGVLSGYNEMTEMEHESKFARIYRYKRALHLRNARKTAISEHDKITEFIDFMKNMTLEKRTCTEVLNDRTPTEVAMARSQQTLDKDEYTRFAMRWEQFTELKEKINKLQDLQKEGVTSLKGVDLSTSKKKNKVKKNSEALKKAEQRFKAFKQQHIRMYTNDE